MSNDQPEQAMPFIQVCRQRGGGDCGIACLSMYLGQSYEDVLAAAVKSTKDKKLHHKGVWMSQVVTIAKSMGVALRKRKKWDWDTSTGIVGMNHAETGEGHVVVLKFGLIFDTDERCWEPEAYFSNTRYIATALLTQD